MGLAESEGIQIHVRLSYKSFEEDLMALLTAIEESHYQNDLASSSKLVNRENKDLKRLSCSVNYDLKGGSSNRGKIKGRGILVSFLYE